MKWFGENSLEGLIECVKESILSVVVATKTALEELHKNMQGMDERIRVLEQNAVTIRYAEDGKLDILPATTTMDTGTESTTGEGGA